MWVMACEVVQERDCETDHQWFGGVVVARRRRMVPAAEDGMPRHDPMLMVVDVTGRAAMRGEEVVSAIGADGGDARFIAVEGGPRTAAWGSGGLGPSPLAHQRSPAGRRQAVTNSAACSPGRPGSRPARPRCWRPPAETRPWEAG
jgi:hypothetical protein